MKATTLLLLVPLAIAGCRNDNAATADKPNKPAPPPLASSDVPTQNDLLPGLGQKPLKSADTAIAQVPPDAEKEADGVASKVITPGNGSGKAAAGSIVELKIAAYDAAGRPLGDGNDQAQKIPYDKLPQALTEPIAKMSVGETRRVWLTEELAKTVPGLPQGPIVLDLTLVSVQAGEAVPADLKAPPADAEKGAGGLAWKVLTKGTGTTKPGDKDLVKLSFSIWTPDGKQLASTRGEPKVLPVDAIPSKGFVTAVTSMVAGEKRRVWIPDALSIQDQQGPVGPVVVDLELVDIVQMPKTPPDVAAPPKDAEKLPDGLASKVLQKGTGTVHPSATSVVECVYSGWTTDGKMFDTSLQHGGTAKFPLNQVIKGWTEGVPLMVEGEKRRFWIPEDLAYKGQPDKPQGMLVFDVELVKIVKP